VTPIGRTQLLLSRYQPVDPEEVGFRERMLALAKTGPAALSREAYEPGHFTASAFVLSPDRTSLLLILHRKLGSWLQPGGHIEPLDEDPITAARREVLEEVGLESLVLEQADIFDVDIHDIPPHGAPAHRHFDVRFLFRAPSLDFRAGSDARDARWVPLADVASIGSDASVMRAVKRITEGSYGAKK